MAHLDADLAVTLDEDRPGMLAKALGCVSGAGINIDGYAEIGGVVHVLAPNLRGARACLETSGFRIVQEQQVVLVPVPDTPGAAGPTGGRKSKATPRYTRRWRDRRESSGRPAGPPGWPATAHAGDAGRRNRRGPTGSRYR